MVVLWAPGRRRYPLTSSFHIRFRGTPPSHADAAMAEESEGAQRSGQGAVRRPLYRGFRAISATALRRRGPGGRVISGGGAASASALRHRLHRPRNGRPHRSP